MSAIYRDPVDRDVNATTQLVGHIGSPSELDTGVDLTGVRHLRHTHSHLAPLSGTIHAAPGLTSNVRSEQGNAQILSLFRALSVRLPCSHGSTRCGGRFHRREPHHTSPRRSWRAVADRAANPHPSLDTTNLPEREGERHDESDQDDCGDDEAPLLPALILRLPNAYGPAAAQRLGPEQALAAS